MSDHEVLIIGAGVAGLTCAADLATAGLDVTVLEASDTVGGRVRTDVIDGYQLDLGFQVFNPSYPLVQDLVDVEALDLRPFTAGVACRSDRQEDLLVLADVRREPQLIGATLRSGKLHPASLASLARWYAPVLNEAWRADHHEDETLREALDRVGLRGPLRSILDHFLTGVLLEDAGTTSNAFALKLARSFLRGTPSLPAAGMQAFPQQLHDRLPAGTVQFGRRVEEVSGGKVRTADGEELTADLVVVATDPQTAQRLTGRTVPEAKGCTTHWFAMDEAPTDLKLLVLDERATAGPVVNTAVLTNVAPEYAPPGRHLVQATCLLPSSRDAVTDEAVREALSGIYATDTSSWDLLRRDDIPYALPAQPAPFRRRQELEVEPGLIVTGDWCATGSVQGAMSSGRRAAEGWLQRRS